MSHAEKETQNAPLQRLAAEQSGGTTKAAPPLQLQATGGMKDVQWADNSGTNRSAADQVALYISEEMNTNGFSEKAASIKEKWASWNPIKKVEALFDWKDMVDYRAPWDHKPMIMATWGEFQNDPGMNLEWYHDIWSNIHYGYVGRACGFSESILLNGAGLAQLLGSNVPGGLSGYLSRRVEQLGDADVFRAMDDPSDQLATSLGCQMWGSTTSEAGVLGAMRRNADSLNHR